MQNCLRASKEQPSNEPCRPREAEGRVGQISGEGLTLPHAKAIAKIREMREIYRQ